MNTPDTQFKLRIPADLKARLEDASANAGRSLTAEIVTRLEWSLEAQLLDQVEQLHTNLGRVRSLSATVDTLKADLARYAEGDRKALAWLLGADGALSEATALDAARLALETMEERLYALRSSVATIYQAIEDDGREPHYYARKF
ncbi:TPA: Arc family DNA-binding protein [Stenotrophomonas maltophilia]